MDRQPRAAQASSVDARTFTLEDHPGWLAPGDLVVLTVPGGPDVLAQLLDDRGGSLLGVLAGPDRELRTDAIPSFPAAGVHAPAPADLEAFQRSRGADLEIGTWSMGEVTVPARLRTQGFSRHTFLCGQSGSGKTYALGVVLEQLLTATDLRIAVLDPNADFVRLGEPRPDAPPSAADQIRAVGTRVLGAQAPAEPLRMRLAAMPRAAQAAVLRLDPLVDRAEYNLFLHSLDRETRVGDVSDLVRRLLDGGADERALGQRIENLGLTEWEVWARDQASAAEVLDTSRATVLDLAGLRDPREATAVALEVIESLWSARAERRPILIVIDEAHNICPAEPEGEIQRALVARLIQVAAEGRKYGLWLLLSSQRPSKVHPQVLSQCDNLMLMRMNSPADVHEIGEVFGFAPPAMIQAAPHFTQGEALVAGAFAPRPTRLRIGARLTHEGGGDLQVPVHGA